MRKITPTVDLHAFSSLPEFYRGETPEKWTRAYLDSKWMGATIRELNERKFAWEEGAKKLSDLPELGGVQTSQKSKIWHWEEGDYQSKWRDDEGLPSFRKRVKRAGKSRWGAVAKVRFNAAESYSVEANQMLWKVYAICRIVDDLESKGIRCEVIFETRAKEVDLSNPQRDTVVTIPVKEANEPLNLGLLATVCSPWFFRYWILGLYDQTYTNLHWAHGYPKKIEPDEESITINSGECLSKREAEKFIKNLGI